MEFITILSALSAIFPDVGPIQVAKEILELGLGVLCDEMGTMILMEIADVTVSAAKQSLLDLRDASHHGNKVGLLCNAKGHLSIAHAALLRKHSPREWSSLNRVQKWWRSELAGFDEEGILKAIYLDVYVCVFLAVCEVISDEKTLSYSWLQRAESAFQMRENLFGSDESFDRPASSRMAFELPRPEVKVLISKAELINIKREMQRFWDLRSSLP